MHAPHIIEASEGAMEALEHLAEQENEVEQPNTLQRCYSKTKFYIQYGLISAVTIVGAGLGGAFIQATYDYNKHDCEWYAQHNCTAAMIDSSCSEPEGLPRCQLSSFALPITFVVITALASLCTVGERCLRRPARARSATAFAPIAEPATTSTVEMVEQSSNP